MDEEKAERLREAEALSEAGCHKAAAFIYSELAAASPHEDSLLFSHAWSCLDGGSPEEAIACFEKLFALELSRPVFTGFAYDELVRLYRDLKMTDRLVDVCERAVRAFSRDVNLLGALGDAYLETDRFGDAVGAFTELLAVDPESAIHYCRLGDAHVGGGDFTKAAEAYKCAAAIEPEGEAVFYCRFGNVCLKKGNPEEALKAFRQALHREPLNALYHCLVGDCRVAQGKIQQAIGAYEQAAALSPHDAGVFFNRLGNALSAAQRPQEAADAFRKARAAEPENPFYAIRTAGLPDLNRSSDDRPPAEPPFK